MNEKRKIFATCLAIVFAIVIAPLAGRVAAGPAMDANALLLAENKALRTQVASLQKKNKDLSEGLDRQTAELSGTREMLYTTINSLKGEIKKLKSETSGLGVREMLAAKVISLQREISRLKGELKLRPPMLRPKARQPNDAKRIQSPATLKVGNGELRLRFQFTTLYIPANIPKGDDILVRSMRTKQCGYSSFFFIGYRQLAGKKYKKPTEGFVRVNGKPEKLTCESSHKEVVRIIRLDDEEGVCLEALTPGKANILISLARHSLAIPVKVVQIPVRTGDYRIEKQTKGKSHTREDIIKILGLPDKREERLIGWPKSIFCAGQYFSPPAGGWWRIQRWKYAKYPGAEIIFVGNTSARCARSAQTFETADAP